MKGITQGFPAQRCAHVSIIIDPSSFLACSLEIPQTQADVSDEKEINYVHVVLILIILSTCTGGQGICHIMAICHSQSEPTLQSTAESAGIKKSRSASTPSKEFTLETDIYYSIYMYIKL